MKILLSIALILSVTFCVTAQVPSDYDSLKAKVLKIDVAVNNLHTNMVRYERQHKTGLILSITGALLSTTFALIEVERARKLESADGGNYKENHRALVYVGAGASVAGFIISFDALKHLRRGGRK